MQARDGVAQREAGKAMMRRERERPRVGRESAPFFVKLREGSVTSGLVIIAALDGLIRLN
jgi:hypothetical protein